MALVARTAVIPDGAMVGSGRFWPLPPHDEGMRHADDHRVEYDVAAVAGIDWSWEGGDASSWDASAPPGMFSAALRSEPPPPLPRPSSPRAFYGAPQPEAWDDVHWFVAGADRQGIHADEAHLPATVGEETVGQSQHVAREPKWNSPEAWLNGGSSSCAPTYASNRVTDFATLVAGGLAAPPPPTLQLDQTDSDEASRIDSQFFKTSICMFWQQGRCTRRECRFAHGEQELREVPDLTKTAMCRQMLKNGKCPIKNCKYAHSRDELRSTDRFFKSRMCTFFIAGNCRLGSSCRYAHGTMELNGSNVAARSSTTSNACGQPARQPANSIFQDAQPQASSRDMMGVGQPLRGVSPPPFHEPSPTFKAATRQPAPRVVIPWDNPLVTTSSWRPQDPSVLPFPSALAAPPPHDGDSLSGHAAQAKPLGRTFVDLHEGEGVSASTASRSRRRDLSAYMLPFNDVIGEVIAL